MPDPLPFDYPYPTSEDQFRTNNDQLSAIIHDLIKSRIDFNPQATNWNFNMAPGLTGPFVGSSAIPEVDTKLRQMPNTFVIQGHGHPRTTNSVGQVVDRGFSPNTYEAGQSALEQAQFNRVVNSGLYNAPHFGPQTPVTTTGEVTLPEIAQAMGSATNDVKRLVLLACYNAGYTPQEIRSVFPNVEEIIGSEPSGQYPTSGYYAQDMFRASPNPYDPTSSEVGSNQPLYSISNTKTNRIRTKFDLQYGQPTNQLYQVPPQSIF